MSRVLWSERARLDLVVSAVDGGLELFRPIDNLLVRMVRPDQWNSVAIVIGRTVQNEDDSVLREAIDAAVFQ